MTFKNIIFILCTCFATFAKAQHLLFETVDIYTSKVTVEQVAIYESYKKNPHVLDVSLVKVDPPALGTGQIQISYQGFETVANNVGVDERDETNWAWFGQLSDETDIFLTVIGDKVFSKFYLKSVPYTLLPLNTGYHLLIGFDDEVAITKCEMGTHKGKKIQLPSKSLQKQQNNLGTTGALAPLVDNDCNLRVLIAYTNAANNLFDMGVLGQGLIDETNLAYTQSGVNFRVELARVVAINYMEAASLMAGTAYGESLNLPTDLVRLKDGTNGFGTVTQLRNAYQADVVALIRDGAFNVGGGSTAFGVAFGVLNGNFVPDVNNAFFGVGNTNNTTLIAGRFTFAHELGHTQGARHGSDNRTPTFARGFVINNALNGVRTLMCTQTEGGSCTNTNSQTGCRVQRFSNPNISFGGVSIGTTDNDNARRLNATSVNMRNLIMTLNDLVVQNETLGNEVIANHLAHNTIRTNNTVIAQQGSRLNMRAANSILLLPGFHAQTGSRFATRLVSQPCTVAPKREDVTVVSSTHLRKEQNLLIEDLKIYPNPANNFCTIELVNPIQQVLNIELYDHLGRKVLQVAQVQDLQMGIHQYTVNTENLQGGTYFAKVSLGKKVLLKQIVIQK